jgi:sulfite exporter TauE/SafE
MERSSPSNLVFLIFYVAKLHQRAICSGFLELVAQQIPSKAQLTHQYRQQLKKILCYLTRLVDAPKA